MRYAVGSMFSECVALFIRKGELAAVSLLLLATVVRVPYVTGGTCSRQFLAAMPHISMKCKQHRSQAARASAPVGTTCMMRTHRVY